MGVEVEGTVGRGSLAVCEKLVPNSGRRCSVEPTGGKTCGRTQVGTGGVLVAHVALAGMLDLFYLSLATRFSTSITLHAHHWVRLQKNTFIQLSKITLRFLYLN